MFKNMKLGTKLLMAFLAVGVIPFAVIGISSLWESSDALSKSAFGQLAGVRGIKKNQVENFFKERQGDMGVLTETVATLRTEAFSKLKAIEEIKKTQIENYFNDAFLQMSVFARTADVYKLFQELVQYHKDSGVTPTGSYDVTTPEYKKVYDEFAGELNRFYKDAGYYDIFVICTKHGHVMYSAAKEKDLGTNLGHGPYKDSGLAKLWEQVAKTGKSAIVDFTPYAPSNNEPAAFAGSPITDPSGKLIGVLAFQMPLDQLNKITTERTGLGKTGETYLVGPDKLMRSDSFLDPKNHTVKASFANPGKGSVDTEAAREALAGKSGASVINDYNGNPVLSVFAPLKIKGLNWAIICEMDVAEAFSPVDENGEAFFNKYQQMYGYYDLFLINPNGYCFFTAAKEADYQTNLVDGKYSNSNLGELVRDVLKTKQYGMGDFAPYAPSNDDPCAFVAQPVVHDGKVELVVALQLSLEAINNIMQQRDGMGETGETYLIGSDKLMRSDSFLDPANHSVKASFANPGKGIVDTEAAREALAGQTGQKIIIDYNGNPVLSAFAPLKIGGATWALIAEIDESEAFAAVNRLEWLMGIIAIIGILAIIAVALLITRSITKPINRIITGLNDGSDQVASASGEVSGSSQSLAEGSSEQAASIEETSASLEEMSSMTKQNADNSGQADSLMKDANAVIVEANGSMVDLTQSMDEISKASEETSKIIKTIDEIAFQTNLLALNAAVEAARAGEAGAGFAVVADEVRNLALRAAEAAKNTAELIEGTVKRVDDGTSLVEKTNTEFTKVAESAAKVGELVSEISAASTEQAQGIEEVNTAVTEMDKVTQQNAANAEESASAAEEMSAQAEEMRSYVNELVVLVGGKAGQASTHARPARKKAPALKRPVLGKAKALAAPQKKQANPEEVLPLDDKDFEDF